MVDSKKGVVEPLRQTVLAMLKMAIVPFETFRSLDIWKCGRRIMTLDTWARGTRLNPWHELTPLLR